MKLKYFMFLILLLILWGGLYFYNISQTSLPTVKKGESESLPQITCHGNGPQTLVAEAGARAWSIHYQPMLEFLELEIRVCLVDRVGYYGSEANIEAPTVERVSQTLKKALAEEGITEPFFLAGHSSGGMFSLFYQHQYPEDILGLILIDSVHPDQFEVLPESSGLPPQFIIRKNLYDAQKNQRTFTTEEQNRIPAPENLEKEFEEVAKTPEYFWVSALELFVMEDNLEKIGKNRNLRDLPLLILASEKNTSSDQDGHNQKWIELQEDFRSWSSRITYFSFPEDHYFLIKEPKTVSAKILKFIKEN